MEARLAQSVEHETLNLRVVGSSPTLGDHFFVLFFQIEILILFSFCCVFETFTYSLNQEGKQ